MKIYKWISKRECIYDLLIETAVCDWSNDTCKDLLKWKQVSRITPISMTLAKQTEKRLVIRFLMAKKKRDSQYVIFLFLYPEIYSPSKSKISRINNYFHWQ